MCIKCSHNTAVLNKNRNIKPRGDEKTALLSPRRTPARRVVLCGDQQRTWRSTTGDRFHVTSSMTRHCPVREHSRLAEEKMPTIRKELLVRGVAVAEQLFDRLPCCQVHVEYASLRNHGHCICHRHHALWAASLVRFGCERPQLRAEFRVHCTTRTHAHVRKTGSAANEGKLQPEVRAHKKWASRSHASPTCQSRATTASSA